MIKTALRICAELQRLSGLMHDAGYVPNTKFVLHDVEEEEKSHLCDHSKKLAICIWAREHSSWYSSPIKKTSAGL